MWQEDEDAQEKRGDGFFCHRTYEQLTSNYCFWVFKRENLVDLKTLGELCCNSEDWGLLYFQHWSYHTGLRSEAKVSAEQIIWKVGFALRRLRLERLRFQINLVFPWHLAGDVSPCESVSTKRSWKENSELKASPAAAELGSSPNICKHSTEGPEPHRSDSQRRSFSRKLLLVTDSKSSKASCRGVKPAES